MKRKIQTVIMLAFVAIVFAGCHPTTPSETSLYKPSKYEVNSVDGTPVRIEVTYIGRTNQTGDYLSTDPEPNTIEVLTPWEYAMMTCKDFTYSLIAENIDTINAILIGKVVIDDVTVAEQSGEKIILKYEE